MKPPRLLPRPFFCFTRAAFLGAGLLAGTLLLPAADSTPAAVAAPPTPTAPAIPPANGTNTAIVPVPRNAGWVKRHDGFVDLAKAGNIDVLFLGDSITDYWRDDGATSPHRGKPVWDKYYGSMKAANFGISADRTQHVLWRLQNGEGQGFKPKVVVLMIGTNNTGLEKPPLPPVPRNTVPEAIAGVTAVVQELRKDFPDAKILLLGIFPRGDKGDLERGQVAQINQAIMKLNDQKHVFYLDIGDKFLQPDGSISPEVMKDKLHPTTKGYEIWATAMQQPLADLLKN